MKRLIRSAFCLTSAGVLSVHAVFAQFAADLQPNTIATSLVSKRELRGAWIATVTNLDWPSSSLRTTGVSQQQKDGLIAILDQLAAAGFNSVIFQVRTECDALYNSPFEPWSYWLTGAQGTAPSPFYDPLEFAVAEAHKRGMEIHAWFNPYRAERSAGNYQLASNHATVVHPDWVLQVGTYRFLNPGLSATRDFVSMIISDVVRRYDIDGAHMDDYFYQEGITTQDTSAFRTESRGITNIGDWRRDNVNLLIRQVYDSIAAIKSNVKWGISPRGIWRNGTPQGTFGADNYNVIYCDAIAWLQAKSIDYINPQLYWQFGGGQDYALLQRWWADSANAHGRHIYTGNATYRINSGTSPFSTDEILKQINFNRANSKVQGSIQFRALSVTGNQGGNLDLLKSDVFLYGSMIPSMSWKPDVAPPNAPSALASTNPGANSYSLQWTPPSPATDGDTAARYGVYRFTTQTPQQSDIDNGKNLLSVVGQPTANLRSIVDTVGVQFFYGTTALDRNNNEGALSNVISLTGPNPTQPVLASPLNGDQNFPRGGAIKWNVSPNASAYRVEFDSTSGFGPASIFIRSNVNDTAFGPTGLVTEKTYYWRVSAGNQVGTSGYSATFSFKTGWPVPPTLIAPASGSTNVVRNPTFKFTPSTGTSFRLFVLDATTNTTVLDSTVADTAVFISRTLEAFRVYYWKVAAINASGSSDFTELFSFRTMSGTLAENEESLPNEYALSQNYPNPFNPVTTIQVVVPRAGLVTLRVYDILGRDVATLVDGELLPGVHTFRFDGSSLPSGTYFYVLMTSDTRIVKKMMFLK